MNARIRSSVRFTAVAAGLTLGLAPIAGAAIVDGRSPDTKDAAATAQMLNFDGRSPDTKDAAATATDARHAALLVTPKGHPPPVQGIAGTPSVAADLRSPDTKDAAELAHTTGSTVIVEVGSSGFDWTDAGIGAAGGFGAALMVTGTVLLSRLGSRRKLAL